MDKMVMKINDIESRLMSEIKERREQTKNINARFDIVEEALNAKKVLETTTGLGSTLKETIQSLQMQLEEIKENANDVDIAETLKAVEVLKKGFQDEKKESYKLRIRVAQLQEMVKSLAGETGNDAPAVTSTDKQYDTESTRPKSCLELQQLGYTSSGLYTVHVKDNNSKRAIQVSILE